MRGLRVPMMREDSVTPFAKSVLMESEMRLRCRIWVFWLYVSLPLSACLSWSVSHPLSVRPCILSLSLLSERGFERVHRVMAVLNSTLSI